MQTSRHLAAWALMAASIMAEPAQAIHYWNNASGGDYNTGANWNPSSTPTSADDVYIAYTGYPLHGNVVTIGAAASCKILRVGQNSGTNNSLVVNAGGLTTAGAFDIGGGNTFQHLGGTSTLGGGTISIGGTSYGVAGQTARFLLDGGTVLTLGKQVNIGIGTTKPGYLRTLPGTILDTSTSGTQSGAGGILYFGQNTSPSSWDFDGGTVYIGSNLGAGYAAACTVTQAEGTRLTVNGIFSVATTGSALWTQNGGTNLVTGDFRMANGALGVGVYNLNGGVLTANGANSYLTVNTGNGTFNQSGGTATFKILNLGYSTGYGIYNLSGGTLNANELKRNANVNTVLNLTDDGVLSVNTVSFDLVNTSGTVAPGQAGATGKTQVTGTFASGATATMQLQLGGTVRGTTYDWLNATGAITLDGILSVPLVNSFTPGAADTFTNITGSAVNGVFANAPVSGNRYNLGGGSFIVTYNAASVVLSDFEELGTAVDNAGGELDVMATTAKIRGTLLAASATPTTCRFYWWQSGSDTTNMVPMGTRVVGETFTNSLSGLSANTAYYYQTYATNTAGEAWAATAESFTTFGPPAVETLAAQGVDNTVATLRGQLAGVNNAQAIIYWGLTDGEDDPAAWGNTNVIAGTQIPNVPFSSALSSLTTFTNYYFRCYATNAYGETWAAETLNFTTESSTTDWRWSTPGGGDYRVGTNFNGGNVVIQPPTSADRVWIGYNTYPAAQYDCTITIDEPAYAYQLVVGYHGTNNTLVVNAGGLTTAGQFDIGAGNTFQQVGGDSVLAGGGNFVGNQGVAGQTARFLHDGGTVKTLGQALNVGYSSKAGYFRTAAGTLLDTSTFGTQSGAGGNLQVGQSSGVGTWDFLGGTVYVNNLYVGNGGAGTVTQAEGTHLTVNGTLHAGYTASGLWTQNGGTNTVADFRLANNAGGVCVYNLNGGVLTSISANSYLSANSGNGTVNQSGGTATFQTLNIGYSLQPTGYGVYNLSGGTLNAVALTKNVNVSSAFTLTGDGVLSVDTVQFDLSNGGTVAPGQAGATGKTQVNGTFANGATATVQIQLGGTGQGTTYDWVNATGAVTLDGDLTVALVNAFVPGGGDTFTVVSGSSVGGVFANAPVSGNRYNLGGGSFIVTYNAASVVLSQYEGLGTAVDNDGGELDVLATTAKIRGTLLSESASPTTCRFYWWQSGSDTTNMVPMGTRVVGETFTNSLSGLSANTAYYYQTYATNTAGEAWAATAEGFTTFGPPAVANLAVQGVDNTVATPRGQLTGVNNGEATIYWGLTDGEDNAADWDHTNVIAGTQVPNVPFSTALSSLTTFTNYYYRCYAANAYGDDWAADTVTFFTESATTDWRWSTPGGGDYRVGTNYNGGNVVIDPPSSADRVWIGHNTYPAAQNDTVVTIGQAANSQALVVGYHGTNNTLMVNAGGLTTAGQFDIGAGNTFQHLGGDSVLTGGGIIVGNQGVAGQTARFLLDGGTVETRGQTLNVGYSSKAGYFRAAAGTLLDTSTFGMQSGAGGNLQIGQSSGVGTWDFLGGTVYVGGSLYVGNGGAGTVTQAEGTHLTVNGTLFPGYNTSGLWTQNGGTNLITGEFRLANVAGGIAVYNLNGGVLTSSAANSYLSASSGNGTVNQSGGTATFQTLNIGYSGAPTGYGVYNLSGGTLNAVALTKNANVSSAFTLTGDGVLSVNTVQFNLSNGGTVAPGQAGTTGKTQVNGTFANGAAATVQIQLGGTGQGTTYDWLNATGAVSLDGDLNVTLANGFTPGGADTFTVVSGSTVGGVFANAPVSGSRYNLGGGQFIVTYNAGSVVLSAFLPNHADATLIIFR